MIFSIERVVKESGDKLKEEDKTRLSAEVDSAREVLKNSDDVEKLKSALEQLTKVSNEIFTEMYKNAAPQGDPNAQGDPNGQN